MAFYFKDISHFRHALVKYKAIEGLMYRLGIHLDSTSVYGALIRKGGKGVEIVSLKAIPHQEFISSGPNVKPLYTKFGASEKQPYTTTGLSSKDVLIRSIQFKLASHVEEAIAFHSEATTHFNPEEMLTVPLLQKREKGNTEALLFTAPREALKEHLRKWEEWGVDPDCVSVVPLALCRFARWKFPSLLDTFIIDIGSRETTCVLMEGGELKKSHCIDVGIETLLKSLWEDRKKILLKKEIESAAMQIDLLLLKPGLNPHLTAHLNELRQNVTKALFSFARGEKKTVIFTGKADAFTHLREFLIEDLESSPLEEEQKFAISIGLALEQTQARPLQLRREEFFPKKNWMRLGAFGLSLMSASLLLCVLLFGFGLWSSSVRKSQMLEALQIEGGGEVEEKIDQWIAAVEKNNQEYPYLLQSPKVTEVFSWLSSHPLLKELKEERDPLEILDLRYQLVSYPKLDALKDPYSAKVEIEFRFKSAMNARKFHEALRRGDDLVNPNLEITWDALSESYRASFFLKNRSPYVP